MVGKKQRVRTVLLIIILAAAIVGGVFAISYFKGGVTYPWQLSQSKPQETEAKEEPKTEEPKLVITEKPKAKEEAKPVEEVKEPEVKEESDIDETEEVVEEQESLGKDASLKYYGKLSVEGSQLVDENGDAAILTGVSTHGINWYPEYASADSIKSLRDTWGINVIRLAMYTSDYNGYCVGGQDNQDKLKGIIDEAVEAATDNEMYVIIDWHILNDSDPNEYKSEAIQFFGEMVRKYESYDNVIYEICNEPNGDTTWSDIRKYANEVIPVIRNVDEDAIILVGTPKWSSDLESVLAKPLKYDNIMYTYHFYAGTHHEAEREALMDALEEELPVFISEYGLVNADGDGDVDKDEADEWLGLMKEYGLSSCMWNLSNKDEGSAMINSDCDKVADFTEDDLSESANILIDTISDYKKTVSPDDSKKIETKTQDKEKDVEEETIDSKDTSSETKSDKDKTAKKDKESKKDSKSSKKNKSNR